MSELIKVYAPDGEMFENSPANARDLVSHAGWSLSPLVKITQPETIVETVIEPVPVVEEVVEPAVEEPVVELAVEETIEEAEEVSEEVSETDEVKPTSTRGRKKK